MRNEFGSVTVPEDLGSEQNYYKYIPGYKPVSTSTPVESLVKSYIESCPLGYHGELNTYIEMSQEERRLTRNIGVLRLIGLGDVLMSTQEFIPSLRKTFPDDKITYITNESSSRLLVGNQDIDDVMIIKWNHDTSPIVEPPLELEGKFDVLVNLVNRVDFLPTVLKDTRPKNFTSVGKDYFTDKFKNSKRLQPVYFPQETVNWIDGLRESCGLTDYIACSLNSMGIMKHYPVTKWARLAEIMPDKTFVWTASHPNYKTENLINIKIPSNVINLSAGLSFEQYLAIWGSASCCVGTDSGGMNLAGHMGVPFVGLMGSTKWTQHTSNYKYIYPVTTESKLDCMPCMDWQVRSDCQGDEIPWCMNGIEPKQIQDKIHDALAKKEQKSFFGFTRNYFK